MSVELLLNDELEYLSSSGLQSIQNIVPVLLDNDKSRDILDLDERQALAGVYLNIKKHKYISKAPLAAAISCISQIDQHRTSSATIIISSLLKACLDLVLKDGFIDVIHRGLNSFRILYTKTQYNALVSRMSINSIDIKDVFEYLEQLKGMCDSQNITGTHLLYGMKHLLKLYLNNAEGYQKREFTSKVISSQVNTSAIQIATPLRLDIDETQITSYCEQNMTDLAIAEPREYGSDSRAATTYREPDLANYKDINTSIHLLRKKARQATLHIYKREKQLTCDFRQLTCHEIRYVVKFCYKHRDQLGAFWLLMITFTGRSIEALKAGNININTAIIDDYPDYFLLQFPISLPSHLMAENISMLIQKNENYVQLLLPRVTLNLDVYLSKSEPEIIESVNQIMEEISQNTRSRVTLSRIENALSVYLHQHQIDSAEIAFITGKEIDQTAGCFYHSTARVRLLFWHQKFLQYVYGRKIGASLPDKETYIGSHLIVKSDYVALLFDTIRQEILNTKYNLIGLDRYAYTHNNYTCFMVLLLNLASGHRPVRHPFCFREDFDLLSKRLFISDKEGRNSLSARIIQLPSIIITYLEEYDRYLKCLSATISPLSRLTSECIKEALHSKKPYLFFIENGKYVPVIPGKLKEYFDDKFPLPLNWHRHFLRSWLANNGIHPHIVDAWMGHTSSGGEPLSKYSGLSYFDLNTIANHIEILLCTHLDIDSNGIWGIHDG